ncbi:hypothetical protein [Streptomyces sp. 058-1L]|uniref:hypothetical protein n=1 Tax=Streptomyces sp. 058-1L TaxID=2789266 RepID=UPI003981118D
MSAYGAPQAEAGADDRPHLMSDEELRGWLRVAGGSQRWGDVLAAATVRLSGDIRQRVLAEAREAAQHTSAAEQV